MISLQKRRITVTFTLGSGTFADTGSSSLVVAGLRVQAQIEKYGAPSLNVAVIRVYGMTPSQMNALATHWLPYPEFAGNTVSLAAGYEDGPMTTVFQGGLRTAWANLVPSPEGFFEITAYTAYLEALSPGQPLSYPNAVPLTQALGTLAQQMGLMLEANGVNAQLPAGSYFWGSPRIQAQKAADAAGVQLYFDDLKGALVVVPPNGSRAGASVVVSKTTGLVGYPKYIGSGIAFKTIFNPDIIFLGQVQVESIVQPANGNWTVRKLTHDLESWTPRGAWFTEVEGYVTGTQ